MLVFSNYVHRILESDDPNVNTHQGSYNIFVSNRIQNKLMNSFYFFRHIYFDSNIFFIHIPICYSRHCSRWLGSDHSVKVRRDFLFI